MWLLFAQVIVERAAAVVGNLSTLDGNFQALREAGVMQRLVHLLEQGPQVLTPARSWAASVKRQHPS